VTNHCSSAVGWVVALRNTLLKEGREYIQEARAVLQGNAAKTRNALGWAIALFFLNQVRLSLLDKINNSKITAYSSTI